MYHMRRVSNTKVRDVKKYYRNPLYDRKISSGQKDYRSNLRTYDIYTRIKCANRYKTQFKICSILYVCACVYYIRWRRSKGFEGGVQWYARSNNGFSSIKSILGGGKYCLSVICYQHSHICKNHSKRDAVRGPGMISWKIAAYTYTHTLY